MCGFLDFDDFVATDSLGTDSLILRAITQLSGIDTVEQAYEEWGNGYRVSEIVDALRENGLSDDEILDTCWGTEGSSWAKGLL